MAQKIEFIEYNPENCKSEAKKKVEIPALIINGKTGSIIFNAALVSLLKIQGNQKISFVQEKIKSSYWYLTFSGRGFDVKQNKRKGNDKVTNTSISNTIIVRKIINSLITVDTNVKVKYLIPIGIEPIIQDGIEYYSLITSNAKLLTKKQDNESK